MKEKSKNNKTINKMPKNLEYKFEHFGITVSNIEKSIDFYRKNFGFEEIKKADKPDLELKLALLKLENSLLELLQPYLVEIKKPEKCSLKTLLQKIGSAHLAVSIDNLKSSYQKLKENNVELTDFNEKYFFCKDPDGYLIEVRQT